MGDKMKFSMLRFALALMATVCLGATGLTGCASGEVGQTPAEDASNDTGDGPDAGTDGQTDPDGGDTEEDTVEPPPEPVPTLAPSGGGATVETNNHRIRLIVAPRGGAQTLETTNHRIRLGAGQAQHGQER
jgi:hypothetical protein